MDGLCSGSGFLISFYNPTCLLRSDHLYFLSLQVCLGFFSPCGKKEKTQEVNSDVKGENHFLFRGRQKGRK